MRWLSTIRSAEAGKVVVERMELDDKGFPHPTGEIDELAADTVVLALGQDVDLSLVQGLEDIKVSDGVVQVGPTLMTDRPGVFAGGDMVPDERTVTVAIGHGHRAADNIDAWLRGREHVPEPPAELAAFDVLNTWYYDDAPATVRPTLDAARRRSTFDEVVGGLAPSTALFEARRCMSCGNCFQCDNCFGVCPDNAVIKLSDLLDPADRHYRIDLDYCKGCGLCATECPCGAIVMQPETI
jgi:Pyruvate/2-oxoacid:ferredoxin oxidoreductase delta subunit